MFSCPCAFVSRGTHSCCAQVGFSPEVHLLAAWDASVVIPLVQDRLFCKRTGRDVPFSFQEYPHSIGNKLSAKVRVQLGTDMRERERERLGVEEEREESEGGVLVKPKHFLLRQVLLV